MIVGKGGLSKYSARIYKKRKPYRVLCIKEATGRKATEQKIWEIKTS